MMLLIDQYSTGKTTFIRHLLDNKYPGEHTGVEPTTDRFLALMNGGEDRVIPGNAAAVNQDLPFRGLNHFGQAFLSRFQVSETPSSVIENMALIDTPGILAGDKQCIERGDNFTQVIEWFSQHADLILLMFDSHKLDISNGFKLTIHNLRDQEKKIRVVLNKSNMVSQQQRMRMYGAMMGSLAPFGQRNRSTALKTVELIEAESKDLLVDLKELRRNASIHKVNEVVKRTRLAKIQNKYHIPAGDFPNPERFKQNLVLYDIDKLKSIKEDLLEKVDEVLAVDHPKLMSRYPMDNTELGKPRQLSTHFPKPTSLDGLVSGSNVKPLLENSGLPNDALAHIWRLADWDSDSYLDSDQFGVALHLMKAVEMGAQLPGKLPSSMILNRKI
ncbi:hypothetical protein G6F43_005765 [Rhizopus delemar]|nr:hypothetical protein G6F43_005765 [Rhizopus delemar]